MNRKARSLVLYSPLIILGLLGLFTAAFKAQQFFIPLSIAILLSLVMIPLCNRFEKWGISKGWSAIFADLILLSFCVVLFTVLGLQVSSIQERWPEYKKKVIPKLEQFQNYIANKTGISQRKQKTKIQNAYQKFKKESKIGSLFINLFTFSGNFLLVFVYIFFFLRYRQKFMKSILHFIPENKKQRASEILKKIGQVSQQYLFGRFILILILAVFYSIGFSIVGIKHAIFIAIFGSVLSIVPYIGNIAVMIFASLMASISKNPGNALIGALIVFSIAQFIESYVLTPYLVGHKVKLNPAWTIISVVAGGTLWGVAGMIMAIPVVAIIKAISDNVPVLHPIGYTLGEEDISSSENKGLKKIKDYFKKHFT